MPQETWAQPILVGQSLAKLHRETPLEFQKRSRLVKPMIVAVMLHDAASDRRQARVYVVHPAISGFRPSTHLAINDIQPVGNSRSRQEVGIIEISLAMGKVVHYRAFKSGEPDRPR